MESGMAIARQRLFRISGIIGFLPRNNCASEASANRIGVPAPSRIDANYVFNSG
jgi:hypothetical protein